MLEKALMERNWHDKVVLETTGCLKQCSKAPNFTIRPGKQCYNRLHSGVFSHLGSVLETTNVS
jgi:NADH:ubiquinone oxidoreductase subunit E